MKNKLKEMKGITLIALVITIIVLLILAGVSIATLTGENGILTQATSAKQETKQAEADEMFKLIANEWQIEKRKTGARDLETFLAEEAAEYGVTVEDGNVLVYNGEKVQIDNKGTLTEVAEKEEPIALAAGLYDENDNLLISWEDLTSKDYATLSCGCCGYEGPILDIDKNGVLRNGTLDVSSERAGYLNGKLVLDNCIMSIGENVFFECSGLTEIVLQDGVESIGCSSFTETSIKNLILPNTVKTLYDMAFLCEIETIYIPDSVDTMYVADGWGPFYGCNKLKIYCESEIEKEGWQEFWNCRGAYGDEIDVTYGVTRTEYEALIAE